MQSFGMFRFDGDTGRCDSYIYVSDREKRFGGPKIANKEAANADG